MTAFESTLALVQTAVAPAILVGVALWNSDKVISEDGAKRLYGKIEQTSDNPSESPISAVIESFLNRYFSFNDGPWKFLVNVALLTTVSLLFFLAIYTYRTIGLFDQLFTRGFIRQFLGNGFVVTFIVNAFALFSYRFMVRLLVTGSIAVNLWIVLIDLILKILLFIVATGFTYVVLASVGDAFNGDWLAALHAVPITISQAIRFRNLTSVYMYSLVMSSFPIFVVIMIKILALEPRAAKMFAGLLYWLPFKFKPLRAISTVFAAFCGVLAVLTALLVTLLQQD